MLLLILLKFIIIVLVIYPLLFPGTFRALSVFNRYNIIIFLKKFESIYNNIKIKIKTKTKGIPEYCENNIIRKLKGFKK